MTDTLTPYRDLTAAELVEANLNGCHGDMTITDELATVNLIVLKPMLQRKLDDGKKAYKECKSCDSDSPAIQEITDDFCDHYEHMQNLMKRLEERIDSV